jgi:hypothetical protein
LEPRLATAYRALTEFSPFRRSAKLPLS